MTTRQRLRGLVGATVCFAYLADATDACAQEAAAATARALFEEGTKALDRSDWEAACPKFDASYSVKPTVSALLNIGKCQDHAGRLTAAADDYRRALTLNEDTSGQTRKRELAEYASNALAAIEARLPKLRVTLATMPAPQSLQMTRDGSPLPATALGLPIPVDPGEHVIVASAPGRRTQTVRITAAEKALVEVALQLEEDASPAPTMSPGIASVPPPPEPAPAQEARGGAPAWAWATGAVGLAAGGVALYFAIDGATANCGGPCSAPQYSQGSVDDLNARRHRDLAGGIALGAVAVIGIAVGAWGIATSPRARATSKQASIFPVVGRGLLGTGVRGAF